MSGPSYSEFSAGDSMLGYIYQCEYALYQLLDRDRPTSQVWLETMDDIVAGRVGGAPQDLLQLKLHRQIVGSSPRSISERHADLWKTLRVWCSHIQNGLDPATTNFLLLTTAPRGSEADSLIYFLAPKGGNIRRDTVKARARLEQLAAEIDADSNLSPKSALKLGAAAVLALPTAARIHLVNNVTIVTSSPSILQLRQKIDQRLRASGATEQVHAQLVQGVVGWWYSACITHLDGKSARPITFEALAQRIAELAHALNLSSLPHYQIAPTLNDDEMEALRSRTFVKQILAVGHRPDGHMLSSAMLDFYKADAHRKKWIEELRIDQTELQIFEDELRGNWSVHFGLVEAQTDACASDHEPESAYKRLGQRLLYDTLTSSPPELKGFRAQFLARGSYHILAGALQPSIGWHPLWEALFAGGGGAQ